MDLFARRQWRNGGLLLLVAVLALLAWWEPGHETAPAASPLLDVDPVHVRRIRVERPDQAALVFERRAEHWAMIAPESGPANPVLIRPILHLATLRCPLRYPAATLNRAALHLDPPRLEVRLDEAWIRFGDRAPAADLRYLQAGDVVYLCPEGVYALLRGAAAGFLAPALEMPAQSGSPAPLDRGER